MFVLHRVFLSERSKMLRLAEPPPTMFFFLHGNISESKIVIATHKATAAETDFRDTR